jgi:hypothetical protein
MIFLRYAFTNRELLLCWIPFDATSLRNQCLIFSDSKFALNVFCKTVHNVLIYRGHLFWLLGGEVGEDPSYKVS